MKLKWYELTFGVGFILIMFIAMGAENLLDLGYFGLLCIIAISLLLLSFCGGKIDGKW